VPGFVGCTDRDPSVRASVTVVDNARTAWIDASAGIAGDMLLAALADAGAPLAQCQAAVDAVVPGTVRLRTTTVTRAGLRATALDVDLLHADQPHRRWTDIRDLLTGADLADAVRARALAVFGALADAESRVHGVPADDVHFHEVGSWDSIADVVGTCAALEALDVGAVIAGELAVGSGSVRTAHGRLPVPVPAVVELCRGREVVAGGEGELATPTGAALVTTLATGWGPLPAMTLDCAGVGAGRRDRADRPNVVRVLVGRPTAGSGDGVDGGGDVALRAMALLEATIDDLDPRVWPTVIEDLLRAGAADAWITPVIMKKGRPGHVLAVLTAPPDAPALRRLVLDRTSSLGVRQSVVHREELDRAWVDVPLGDATVTVKVGHRDGIVVHATPEFEDVAALARATGVPVREVLDAACAAAVTAGLTPGQPHA
jgi:pyridinium-3,5-bisthiocarboxylic acid mononucleotide nickel chelatase